MELNREFMQETAKLIKQLLPFTTFAAFLEIPTSSMLFDTENYIVYDELLGVPRARETLLYDLLPISQSPAELAFKLSEKKVLAHFKRQTIAELENSVGKEFFEVLGGEFAAQPLSAWQRLFSSTKDDFYLLVLLMQNADTYFAFFGLAPLVNRLRKMSVADVRRLLSNMSSQTAVELCFEVSVQYVYDCIDVFKVQLARHPAEILVQSAYGKIPVFWSGECLRITFADFKFLVSLALTAHELDIMRALYDFYIRSDDGQATFLCHKQRYVWPIIRDRVQFIKGNRLFDLVDVINMELRARMYNAAQFCDVIILTVFGRNMPDIQRLEQLRTFAYPQELKEIMSYIGLLKIEHFFSQKAIFQSYADQILAFYQSLCRRRNGECIEAMFATGFERIPLPGVEIRKEENVGIESAATVERSEIVAEYYQKLASRWVGDGNRCDRSLESSIRDMQEHMQDQDERPTVDELFGFLIERE